MRCPRGSGEGTRRAGSQHRKYKGSSYASPDSWHTVLVTAVKRYLTQCSVWVDEQTIKRQDG